MKMKSLGRAATLGIFMLAAACQNRQPISVPTLMVIPTQVAVRQAKAPPSSTPFSPSPTPGTASATPIDATFTVPPPTETLTATPVPSSTPSPTITAIPSNMPTPAPTNTPEPMRAAVTAQALNVRNGPGDQYDVIAYLEQGASVHLLATDSLGDWLLVEYASGKTGWIASAFVEVSGGAPESLPNNEPTLLPSYFRLENIIYLHQTFNNCSPTALTMALSYYTGQADISAATAFLRPSSIRDVSVDISEMTDYVNEKFPGLRAVWRMGGNWLTLRKLITAGFPVIIETSVQVTGQGAGWAGHNRLIIGYDGDVILTYDGYLGSGYNFEGLRVQQSDLDDVWRHMNRHYMVIYPAERESEAAEIMGEDWMVSSNVDKAHRIALAESVSYPNDAFALFNLGETYAAQKNYTEAAQVYDSAFRLGLPFRIFWYQFGVFEAYYYTGRYNEIVDIAFRALNNMDGMGAEELYYWLGMGYAGRGQYDQAAKQLEYAITFNPRFLPAADALAQIRAGTYKPPV